MMRRLNQSSLDTILRLIKWCTIAVIITLTALSLYFHDRFTLDLVLAILSAHQSTMALILLFMYVLKSLSFFFPSVLLYMVSGLIFTPIVAISLNTLGLWLEATLPYYIGRSYGISLANKLYVRYPKLTQLVHLQHKNEFLFAFMLRITGIVPIDLGSMFLGAQGQAYRPFISGTLLGLFPKMVIYALLGDMIYEPTSPGFLLTVAADILITIGALVFYHRYIKLHS